MVGNGDRTWINKTKNSWLIIKEQYLDRAKEFFSNSKIKITTEGHLHCAVIGILKLIKKYLYTRKSLNG